MKLTELEKTILLSMYVLVRGSTRKYVEEQILLARFPARQRKIVRSYIAELVRKKLLKKSKNAYKINKSALKHISEFLVSGARLRL